MHQLLFYNLMIGSIKAQCYRNTVYFIITKILIILRSMQAVTLDFPTFHYSHALSYDINVRRETNIL